MADNTTAKDASGASVTLRTTESMGVHTPHAIVASSALPTGAATESSLAAIAAAVSAGKLLVDDEDTQTLLTTIAGLLGDPLAVTGPLTDAELRASAVPVSGPLTDTQLRATAVPVSITGGATEAKQDTQITAIGATSDAAAEGSNNGSIIGVLKALRGLLAATAAALADGMGNPTTGKIGAFLMTWNGTGWDRAPGTTANGIDVDVTRLPALVAGSATIGAVNLAQYTPSSGNLPVVVGAALPPGTNNIGDVDVLSLPGGAFLIKQTPTVTAGAYAANDTLGGEMTLANAARASGGSGVLMSIVMNAEDDSADLWQAGDVEVLIFDSNPAGNYTDNATLNSSSLTDADAFLLLGSVVLDQKSALGNITQLKATNINLPYVCSGSANLFAVAINRGARTPEATDSLQFVFGVVRD
jgi:hypothetical protein